MPPEPLPPELRHRCFGCSLAPVCLPEETLYLIHQPDQEPATARSRAAHYRRYRATPLPRVIPKNDDKAVLYVHEPGSHVGRRSEHLVVSLKGQEVKRVPIVSVRQVVVFGNVQVSTQALQTLAEADVPVVFLSGYGKFIATVMPAPPKNVALRGAPVPGVCRPGAGPRAGAGGRRRQDRQPANAPDAILAIAAARFGGDGGDDEEPGVPTSVASDEPAARDMAEMLARVATAPDPGVLLGLEGQAAARLFRQLRPDAQGQDARRHV